jgi:hypothetical protein
MGSVIASRLYNIGGYPATDTSHAIGENLIMTAITPHLHVLLSHLSQGT